VKGTVEIRNKIEIDMHMMTPTLHHRWCFSICCVGEGEGRGLGMCLYGEPCKLACGLHPQEFAESHSPHGGVCSTRGSSFRSYDYEQRAQQSYVQVGAKILGYNLTLEKKN
jgi:hypothetical protein